MWWNGHRFGFRVTLLKSLKICVRQGQMEGFPSLLWSCIPRHVRGILDMTSVLWNMDRLDVLFFLSAGAAEDGGKGLLQSDPSFRCFSPFGNLSSSTSKHQWAVWKTRPHQAPVSPSIFTTKLPSRCELMRENKHSEVVKQLLLTELSLLSGLDLY